MGINSTSGLKHLFAHEGVSLYSLECDEYHNKYFVASHKDSRRLMLEPEEIGFQTYLDTLPSTVEALRYFHEDGICDNVDILTILRGGLNYPVEEASFKSGIAVSSMSFLSCERIIENKVITGLDIKYQKLHTSDRTSLLIGDIIASGDTLRLCLDYVIGKYREEGMSFKRVIFFTIGGTRAIDLMETLTSDVRQFWPDFEGFYCVFYEGIFSVYEDKGVTGVNVPNIDFYCSGGVISPEFKEDLLSRDTAILEKCIIYDGGARRYEIDAHYQEVREYWEDILKVSEGASMKAFIQEKLGYQEGLSFDDWRYQNHYELLPTDKVKALYDKETAFRKDKSMLSLKEIAKARLQALDKTFEQFIKS